MYLRIFVISFTIICLNGCAHRGIGYKQTTGVHPYWVDVRTDGTMDYGIGSNKNFETGKWWKIDSEIIVFINQNNAARYFKFSDGDGFLEQPFRHDTNYYKLKSKEYTSSLK